MLKVRSNTLFKEKTISVITQTRNGMLSKYVAYLIKSNPTKLLKQKKNFFVFLQKINFNLRKVIEPYVTQVLGFQEKFKN
jgi:hypothetical protein